MRISTNTLYDQGLARMQQQTTDLFKTQQQLSTGRRILTPEDDPVGAARVLEVSQSAGINKQYDTNMGSATSALGLEESILGRTVSLIQDVRTLTIQAGNATLNNSDLASLATDIQGRYQELLGLANSTDGNGQYLFSGYRGATKPFTESALGNVSYNGDQGQRLLQISPSRQIPVSDSGSDVFMQIRSGNGTYVATAAAANAGTGLLGTGSATSSYDGNTYQISFTSGSTYDINQLDSTGAIIATPVSGATYTSGSAISVGGGQVEISGAPAGGDAFTVAPSSRQQDIFSTLGDLVAALQRGRSTPADATRLTNDLNAALQNLDNAQNNVLIRQSSVGSRMKEIDSVKSLGEDQSLQYQQTISNLQDLDYAKAISDLTRQQQALDAAQKTFVKVQGMSLFDYL